MVVITLANGQSFDTNKNDLSVIPKKIKTKVTGAIVYKGPSMLDNQPIVAVLTFNTSNEKTGDMAQLWILRADVSPSEAVKTGKDISICGMCPQRHYLGGACYVLPFQAPSNIFKSYQKGNYPEFNDNHGKALSNKSIRLGAYGDPAAIPFQVLENLIKYAKGFTGYTHQAHHKNFDNRIASLCMVSVETENDAKRMQSKGFKTFRVKTPKMELMKNEIICLSDSKGLTCELCGICNGKSVNVAIDIHGTKKGRFDKFERII